MKGRNSLVLRAFARHRAVLEESMLRSLSDVEKGGEIFISALKKGNKVLICGNGGSAADSQHFAAELSGRYKKERRALAGIALTTDTSALTAIGNDYGFDQVFSRQVEALGQKGDVFVAISTSGSSKNILAAIDVAKKKGMKIVALTGAKGAGLKRKVEVCIAVPSEETARIQEMHELIYHTWCELIDNAF